jgi:hypothetical protein
MEPKFCRTGRKPASLVQALRAHISTLCDNAHNLDALFGKPADRVYEKLCPYAPSLRFLADSYQTDLSAPCTGDMAAYVALNLSMIGRNQNILGPSTTALLDPCFIQLIASLNRKISVIVKSGISMAAACKSLKCINVGFDCISYRGASRAVARSAGLCSANIERHPDVNESKAILLCKPCRPLIRGIRQEIETFYALSATP